MFYTTRNLPPLLPSIYLFITHPSLGTPQEGEANEAAYAEFSSLAVKLHLSTIHVAAFLDPRLLPLDIHHLVSSTPQKGHSDNRLILPCAVTFLALRVRVFTGHGENLFYLALIFAVDLDDAYRSWFVCLAFRSFPKKIKVEVLPG